MNFTMNNWGGDKSAAAAIGMSTEAAAAAMVDNTGGESSDWSDASASED